MYYDEANSHPLYSDVFFADILAFTQPMELASEDFIMGDEGITSILSDILMVKRPQLEIQHMMN